MAPASAANIHRKGPRRGGGGGLLRQMRLRQRGVWVVCHALGRGGLRHAQPVWPAHVGSVGWTGGEGGGGPGRLLVPVTSLALGEAGATAGRRRRGRGGPRSSQGNGLAKQPAWIDWRYGLAKPHSRLSWDGLECAVSPTGPPPAGYVSAPCARATRCWRQKYQTPPPDAAVPRDEAPTPTTVSREVHNQAGNQSQARARPQPRSCALCLRTAGGGKGEGAAESPLWGRLAGCLRWAPARGAADAGPPAGGGPHDARPPSGGRRVDSRALNLCRGLVASAAMAATGPRGGPVRIAVGAWCCRGCGFPCSLPIPGPLPRTFPRTPPVWVSARAPHLPPLLFCPDRSRTVSRAPRRCAGRHIFQLKEPASLWCGLSEGSADTGGGVLTVQDQRSGQCRRARTHVCRVDCHLCAAYDLVCIEWPTKSARVWVRSTKQRPLGAAVRLRGGGLGDKAEIRASRHMLGHDEKACAERSTGTMVTGKRRGCLCHSPSPRPTLPKVA